MRSLAVPALLVLVSIAHAENWVEVGADTEAKFYVDQDSIEVDRDTIRVTKRGIYTHTLTENFGGHKTSFKETRGTVEVDCARRINRVIRIDMLDENGGVVWSSGLMKQRMWEDVRPNSHSEATLAYVCARAGT